MHNNIANVCLWDVRNAIEKYCRIYENTFLELLKCFVAMIRACFETMYVK
jgi:hypothetical protein